jgi:acetyl esterase/lipase
VGELEIKANLYRPDDQKRRPVVVWIHGGALIMGHRDGVSDRVKGALLDAGYAIVSIDYRLAPETKLPEIVGDVEDAFAWIRKEGPERLGIDASRIAVMGGSAGGYLTLVAGYRVEPRPAVLVSFWGYGDLIGDWYARPSPHPRHHTIKIPKEEAYAQVSGPPVSDARDRSGDGGAFYQYCRQHGHWPLAVSGWDPHRDAEKFFPYMPVKNVSREYPPTLLIHGREDTDVPYEQSEMMAAELARHGVEHQLISIPGGEHGLSGGDARLVDKAYESAIAFVNRHMR